MKSSFHLGDILSITTDVLMPGGMNAVYEILDFMLQRKHYAHELLDAADKAKPHLKKQFPQLHTEGMADAVKDLEARLDSARGIPSESGSLPDLTLAEEIVHQWLSAQVKKYGEMHEVESL